MIEEDKISLDCPCCGEAIYRPLSWFKKTYSTCPYCDRGVAAAQFAPAVQEIEEAFEAVDDELVHGEPSKGDAPCSGGCCERH